MFVCFWKIVLSVAKSFFWCIAVFSTCPMWSKNRESKNKEHTKIQNSKRFFLWGKGEQVFFGFFFVMNSEE